MSPVTVYLLWVLALAAALFYPVGKMVWIISVRRLQRKLQRTLNQEEIDGQKRRAYFIAVFISLPFSMLFNFQFWPFG